MQSWLDTLQEDFNNNADSVEESTKFDHIIFNVASNNGTNLQKRLAQSLTMSGKE